MRRIRSARIPFQRICGKPLKFFAISRNLPNTHLICFCTWHAAASRLRLAKFHRRSPFNFSKARFNLSLGNTQLGANCMISTNKSFNSRKTGPNFVGVSFSLKPCMHFNNATKSFVPRELRKRSKLWYKSMTVMDGSATNFVLHRSAAIAIGWLTMDMMQSGDGGKQTVDWMPLTSYPGSDYSTAQMVCLITNMATETEHSKIQWKNTNKIQHKRSKIQNACMYVCMSVICTQHTYTHI